MDTIISTIGNNTYCSDGTFRRLFYWIMRRGREAAITIQCCLLCYGKTCSWTHVVWKSRLFVQFNVTYVHILSYARLGCQRCARTAPLDIAHTPLFASRRRQLARTMATSHNSFNNYYCFQFTLFYFQVLGMNVISRDGQSHTRT